MRDDEDADLLLGELLERSFGAGPEGLPTPVDRLAEGRRALRRRHRAGIAATSVGVVVVLGVAFSGALDRGSDADGQLPQLATSGTSAAPSPTAPVAPSTTPSDLQSKLDRLARKARERAHRIQQRLVSDQFPAAYNAGEVVLKDGWRITERVEEPMGLKPPQASLGLVVTNGTDTRWMLLEHRFAQDQEGHTLPNAFGDAASADDPGKGYSRFEDWLASMVDLQGGHAARPLVTVDGDDRLQPGLGAVLVETRSAPVIDGYTSAGDRMAEVRRDGRTWFTVVRGHGADAEVIPVDAAVLAAPTFEAFVDHMASQAASGEGLR